MKLLSDQDVASAVRSATRDLTAKNLVVVIPDGTRTAPVALFYRTLCEALHSRVEKLTFLIALGTHRHMTAEEIDSLVGMPAPQRQQRFPKSEVINHHWEQEETFTQVGTLSRDETSELSQGRLEVEVPIKVNRRLLSADLVILLGPVFPHEVAGFSGGNKYIFPGVGGAEVINFTHWLGALVTSQATIGVRETAVRKAIDLAASRVDVPKIAFCLVTSKAGLHGVFSGAVREAWLKATELSSQVHISWHSKPYRKVLSLVAERYQDLWTGAKGMYKVEPVLEDGGEVIIYAPHITEVSYTHGEVLKKVGYHIRDYFLADWDRFKEYPWGILAHSTHLRGDGVMRDGVECPRITVTLASGIDEANCRALNLQYCDPATIDPEQWRGREEEGLLLVPNAGETLFRLRD